MSVTPIPIAK